MEKFPLSVAIITKNEEENIAACLRSVDFAAQAVVVDSGSMDKTLEIAAGFGCETHREDWHGFGPQKQLAIDRCVQPWILILDADERIPRETAEVIKAILTDEGTGAAGYSFPRKNFFQGRWIKHAGWWPDRILRLFQKGSGKMTMASVHESIEVNGLIEHLNVPIEHFTESDLGKILHKINRYSTLGALESFKEGKRSTPQGAFLRALFTFLQDYFFRGGFLDGSQGLTLAVTDAVNKFFKYAKLSELGRMTCGNNKEKY